MTRLLVGLAVAAARWHLRTLPAVASYRLRPYCWRLDDRHWAWSHRRCRRTPCLIDVRTLAERDSDFERALQRLTQRLPHDPPADR